MGQIVAAGNGYTALAGTRLAGVLLVVASTLLGGCAWLNAKQSELALRPTPGRPANLAPDSELFRPGDERWRVAVAPTRMAGQPVPSQPDQLALWWLPSPEPGAPALLYLHGTFRNLYPNLPKIQALRDAGFSVLAVDYRGWGESTVIVPDEETIAADAQTAWAELQKRQPAPGRRVIFGHSMGGAVAVRLASGLRWQHDYGALVVESSFTRMAEVAGEAGFWGRVAARLTTLEFDAVGRMPQVDAPVLLLHGSADNTVPITLGRRLRDVALKAQPEPGRVRWVELPGGSHSHLHREFKDVYTSTFRELAQRLPSP
jgi:hypothetical protein